jgi:hypothetical protein
MLNKKNGSRAGRGRAVVKKIAQTISNAGAEREAELQRARARALRRATRWWVVEVKSGTRSLFRSRRRPNFGSAVAGPYTYAMARRAAGWR